VLHAARLLIVAGALAIGGCGEKKSEPITDLNAEQQKQVQELNEQRLDEWGRRKK
jgi:hypothetical protein